MANVIATVNPAGTTQSPRNYRRYRSPALPPYPQPNEAVTQELLCPGQRTFPTSKKMAYGTLHIGVTMETTVVYVKVISLIGRQVSCAIMGAWTLRSYEESQKESGDSKRKPLYIADPSSSRSCFSLFRITPRRTLQSSWHSTLATPDFSIYYPQTSHSDIICANLRSRVHPDCEPPCHVP